MNASISADPVGTYDPVNWALFDERAERIGATTEAAKAELFGVRRKQLWCYRHGRFTPKLDKIANAARALDLSITDLVTLP